MRFIRNAVERARTLYHAPGARFHRFWPVFDAHETFLLNPDTTAPARGPHVRDYADLKRTMVAVIVALIPCLLWSFYNTGHQHFAALATMVADGAPRVYDGGWLQGLVFGGDYAPDPTAAGLWDKVVFGLQRMLPIVVVSYGVGLGIEMAFAVWRKEEVSEGYLVTGMLIALIVPASIPMWQLVIAIAFAVVLSKEVFGGTGMNIFNVALMARAFLFFAYPAQISGAAVWVAGNDVGPGGALLVDGYTGPTPLAVAAETRLLGNHLVEAGTPGYFASPQAAVEAQVGDWWDMFLGLIPGSAGETSTLMVLLGAIYLLVTGVASWRTMAGGVLGLVVIGLVMNVFAGDLDGIGGYPIHWHLVSGGFAFGIVFMATDPVTSPETFRGKWIYGFLIGGLTVLVRAVNPAYPEGMMLAILLMNAFAPTIDYFVVQGNVRRRRKRLG